jgi:hypothetical protein
MSSWLRQARLERGWSEEEAAARVRALCRNGARCGMTADWIQDFELGIRHPGAAHTDALSRLYGRAPDPTDETTDTTKE